VKIQGQNQEMLATACQQFLGKSEVEIRKIAQETLEGHQRAIMGNMTVEVMLLFISESKTCDAKS
jgi:flotillin